MMVNGPMDDVKEGKILSFIQTLGGQRHSSSARTTDYQRHVEEG